MSFSALHLSCGDGLQLWWCARLGFGVGFGSLGGCLGVGGFRAELGLGKSQFLLALGMEEGQSG